MSFNAHRRIALDRSAPLDHRASHARSCALLVSQQLRVKRSQVIDVVRQRSGVEMEAISSDAEIEVALGVLEDIRLNGL